MRFFLLATLAASCFLSGLRADDKPAGKPELDNTLAKLSNLVGGPGVEAHGLSAF